MVTRQWYKSEGSEAFYANMVCMYMCTQSEKKRKYLQAAVDGMLGKEA